MGTIVERAATLHTGISGWGTLWVNDCFCGIVWWQKPELPASILAPFLDIAVHIIKSERIRRKAADRSCLRTMFSFLARAVWIGAPVIGLIGCNRLPEVKRRRRSCSTGIFPFSLSRQSICMSVAFA